MSQTDPRRLRTILDALEVPRPGGPVLIDVAPGQYRIDALRCWGTVVIAALGGPGSVVIDGAASYDFRAERSGFETPDATLQAVRARIAADPERFARGNAREIRKLFDEVKSAHARRVAALERTGREATLDDLRVLLPEDAAR
ncbi:hypothetical protein [Streptomyces lavendulae]|uniref:hypothetical protein n=1 Tax=Streptomyces lavendulae TaxID=1914 RepID=UPI002554E9B5|nr:hypothetical protein [Streptomyces lavendulae]